jgi:acetoin utilization protein AcuA
MNSNDTKEICLPMAKGNVRILSLVTPREIRQHTLDPEFTLYENYKSLYTRRKSLEEIAGQPGANVVLATDDSGGIIGFGVLAYPEAGERWATLGPGIMIEIKVIEVARSWRSGRIAAGILKKMIAYPQIEDKIAYMVGYVWTWDLEGTKKTAREYRQLLIRLFEPCGFQEYPTNEPNICLKSENLFMCRIGRNISQVIQDRFKWLRFGLSPWTWT